MENSQRQSRFTAENFANTKINRDKIVIANIDVKQEKRQERNNNTHLYKQSDVRKHLKSFTSPKSQAELVKISESLYVQSPQYNRLINYWSNILTYDYVVVPKDFIDTENHETILEDYKKISKFLSLADLKVNLSKIIKKALISDVFYGYVYVGDNTFMIQQFPYELCKIVSLEDNSYNFAIDVETLSRNTDILVYYPLEIQKACEQYLRLKKSGSDKARKWYQIDSKNSICIKINTAIPETIPPFAGVFDSIYDINAFKDLRNDKAELENYKLLIQKVPVRDKTNENNDFLIDLPMMDYFHELLSDIVPSNVGVTTTPMDIETVTFDKDRVGNDGVAQATKDFWDSSGVSQSLFSGDNNTAQTILKSIDVDEQYAFSILAQLSTWLNHFIKVNNVSKYFKAILPEVTHFNRKEMIEMYLSQGQYGYPVKTYIAGLLGLDPIAMSGLLTVENDILDLTNRMIPFKSSFNVNGEDLREDEGGRPTNEEAGKEDADETARAKNKSSTVIEG